MSACRYHTFAGRIAAGLVAVLALVATSSLVLAQEARVEMELVMEPGFPSEQARKWIAALEKSGISGVRIRGGNVGDRVQIEPTGSARSPSYKVTGILTLDQRLILPGGKFSVSDVGGLSRWLARLQEGGVEGLEAKTGAYGLLPNQLVAAHTALSGKVQLSTRGEAPRDVAEKIAAAISSKVSLDAAAMKALEQCDPLGDELQGLTHGTALAAVIRPAGLVLVPVKAGGQVQFQITSSKNAQESWPIGWPVPQGKTTRDVAPQLLKSIPVEINDTALGDALAAIGGRIKLPLVIDYNALARQRVDLAATQVTLPQSKMLYSRILDRLLFQVRLKYELRLDEADQPFLWITGLSAN